MAIFSKKQNAKKPEDEPKVIVEGAQDTKPQESAPNRLPAAAERTTAETAATPPDAAAPIAEMPAKGSAAHEEVEPEAIETPPVVAAERRFGIDDAIALMRTLPVETNAALVVRVVRATLSAVHVSIEEIVEDALRKETRVKESIAKLETQIVDLDKQLGILRREIATQQADLKETAAVRERLHMTDQYAASKLPPPPPASLVTRPSQTKPIVP
jgi:hypothetical protein